LIWGYRFTPGQAPVLVDFTTALDLLANPEQRGCDFLWLHFSLAHTAAERWLRTDPGLPEGFREGLHERLNSTRLEQEADALIAVLHDVPFDFNFDPAAVATVHVCLQPHVLVSARLHPLRSVHQLRQAVTAGQGFRSAAELLAQLLQEQANVLAGIIREATGKVDSIEDSLLANRLALSRRGLGDLRRVLVRLQRLLAPEPAALFRLLNRPPAWVSEPDQRDLRQAAEEFSATVADTATLVERVKLLQEELAARVQKQSNRTLFILTMVTVLALPINLTAALFGMNVGGIPFSQHPHGFLLIIVLLSVLTGTLAYITFGRRPRSCALATRPAQQR